MEFFPSLVMLMTNTTHVLFHLRLSTRSPLRYFLLYLTQVILIAITGLAGRLFPALSGIIMLPYALAGIWLLRVFVTRDSYNRMFFCLTSVFVCSQILRTPPFLVMAHALEWPPDAATKNAVYFYPVAMCLLTPFIFRHVREPFGRILDIAETQKWYLVSLAPLLLAFIGDISHFPASEVPSDHKVVLIGTLMPVCSIAYFVSMYLFLINYQGKLVLGQRLRAAEQLEETYKFYDSRLSEREARLRRLRHDFRHLVVHLEELAREWDRDGILRELAAVSAATGRMTIKPLCENRTVNAVVSGYFAQAEERGVNCVAKAFVPDRLSVSNADLSMILGNALENCVKAASPLKERGYITFDAKPAKGYIIFEFTNNYAPGAYAKGSGVGLASIRQVCEQQNGRMEISDRDGEFRLTLFLQSL